MSEKALGVLQVKKYSLLKSLRHLCSVYLHDKLIISSDRVLVIRGWEEHMGGGAGGDTGVSAIFTSIFDHISAESRTTKSKRKMRERERQADTLEELLKTNKHNFALRNSEITEIRLKKGWIGIKLEIITSKKKYKWGIEGLNNQKKGLKLEDFENMLRPVFEDKLSVKK